MATVRHVKEGELAKLLALYQQLNPEDPTLEPTARVTEIWEELQADDRTHVLGVDRSGELVGSCVLSITPNLTRNARPYGLIENVIVDRSHRGEGYGRRCLEEAIEVANAAECYKVMVLTGTNQEWKLQFYETCGFEREDKTGFVRYL